MEEGCGHHEINAIYVATGKRIVVEFWFKTMMDQKADMSHRIACSDRLMNRGFGLPVQVTNETINENRKQILEVRWLSPDPNDRSKLIEPEPD
jgi:hypothetical protein